MGLDGQTRLPDEPTLAAFASSLNEAGHWAFIVDPCFTVLFMTDEIRRLFGGGELVDVPIGANYFGDTYLEWQANSSLPRSIDDLRQPFEQLAPLMLSTSPDGREGLKRRVHAGFHDIVERAEAEEPPPVMLTAARASPTGIRTGSVALVIRIGDMPATPLGFVILAKPAPGMSQLSAAAGMLDVDYLERIATVARAERRPAAILMADLEASSQMARHLSTEQFFAFGRRLVRAIDACTIDHGGIVGRHAGDGVVAFFLTDAIGSESRAARACIEASRAMRAALASVLERSEVADPIAAMRFGLHWGGTVFVGRITTRGRSEVTALGDEVNEAARIEACAAGSRTLASKSLIERLNKEDARELGIDRSRIEYVLLGDIQSAPEKSRLDAPSVAVSEI